MDSRKDAKSNTLPPPEKKGRKGAKSPPGQQQLQEDASCSDPGPSRMMHEAKRLGGPGGAVRSAVPNSQQKAGEKQKSCLKTSHVLRGQRVKAGEEKTPGLCPLTTGNENGFTGKPGCHGKCPEQRQ